jgi:hypothetical protein
VNVIDRLDENQEVKNFCDKMQKKLRKSFGGSENSRTFAPAFEDDTSGATKEKSSLKDLHRQRSSTRSDAFPSVSGSPGME